VRKRLRKFRIPMMIAVGLLSLIGTTGTAQAQSSSSRPATAAADSGPWHIVSRHSGMCLTIQGASTAQDAAALQFPCNYTSPFNEDWFLDDLSTADPYFHIVNSHSGMCLTIQGASTAQDALAIQFPCDFSPPYNEEWYFEDLSTADPFYHIVNRHSGMCLTIQGASTAQDALAIQFPCNYTPPFNEEWQLVP
jgi:hypothetical protein